MLQAFLDEEKRVLAELEDNYAIALHDINLRLENLLARNDADLPHVIYQMEYQKALKTQVQAILEQLQVNEFETVSDYLTRCYNTGFIGSMYSFHKQGLPFLIPIDQKQVVDAIRHKTKLSKKLYDELGVDIKKLQKNIASEISRGISTGLGYGDIARNISLYSKAPLNRAMTIARTESHRIQCQATSDAQYKAKEKGADVLKQWDAALDGATRPNHRKLDGQIRELDEPFEVAGMKAMFPGDFGKASEDCNCRCAILQRARWALDEEELEELKERAEYYGLDKSKDFEDFQKKYMKASEQVRDSGQKMNDEDILENLEKQFSDLTEGYSYDDFINDFGTIEDGFEGSSDAEIAKAKKLSDRIKSLRSELNNGKASVDNTVHTKQESIKILQNLGIDFKDNSSGSISDETLSNFADFIANFESSHSGYFNMNDLQLKSISIVDDLIENGKTVGGAYYSDSQSIRLMKKAIETMPTSKLITYSKSDDYRMHFLAHEYGHYIADSLDKNLSITDYDVVQNALLRYFEDDIFKAKPSNLVDALGSYGSKNAREAFAEAFAEAYTSKEPRKFARIFKEELEKVIEKNGKNGIIKVGDGMPLDLQLFAEADIKNQSSNSLKRAMRKYESKISEHEAKIKDPAAYVPDWETKDVREQTGLIRHWQKEIRNFEQSINDRIDELKERGDYDE